MNMLNSIILEGTVKETVVKECNGLKDITLKVETERYFKRSDGTTEKETSLFEVYCIAKLADAIDKYAKNGRGVRVVGRLKQETWNDTGLLCSKVVILAEHIEFKPFKEKENVN